MNLETQAAKLPQKPGIYKFLAQNLTPIYIGKAKNLRKRVRSYFLKGLQLGPKTTAMIAATKKLDHIVVDSEIEALLLEAVLIKKFQPKYNAAAKDDKSHLYIKITVADKIPLITTARRKEETQDIKLFGPFPSSATVRSVLKILRRIFPYVSQKHSYKLAKGKVIWRKCLYCHLDLCPAPFDSEEKAKEYRKTIKKIILFLSGARRKLIETLRDEMRLSSEKLEFEAASKLKKQIEDLEYITSATRTPEEYLRQPDLAQDIAKVRVLQLAKVLNLASLPERIECYDISNIAGKIATGSLVVFENGEPAKEWYRKFKLKISGKPNDVGMLEEVLVRRFKNDWPKADLIIVDGGKGQLGAVGKVLSKLKLRIPYIALAKKQEEIFIPDKNQPVRLDRSLPALQLVQALRDEAHRFAIVYHKKLRDKIFLKGVSTNPGF